KGQRSVRMPKGWETIETRLGASPNPDVRALVLTLSLTFGSEKARTELRQVLADSSKDVAARRVALDSLAGIRGPELPASLPRLLRDRTIRGAALRALAGYQDAATPAAVLNAYATFDAALKRDALNTLVSRPPYAKELLASIAANQIPSKDLTADIV